MLIEIHLLQNHAPSNLNRDDTGAPKDAMFGGYRRGRISSQCLKRSIRRSEVFREQFPVERLGERTKLLPLLLDEALRRQGTSEEIRLAVIERAPEIGAEAGGRGGGEEDEAADAGAESGDAEPGRTKQLVFISPEEVDRLAERLATMVADQGAKTFRKQKIADLTRALGGVMPRSVDIAMFGRMTTSTAFEDVAAAVQVAHAISTNRVDSEFDYFTAVDDVSGETGAGMIGDVEFNSATYYKYLSVHWDGLVKNLAGDREVARQAVGALIQAAALANPSGKQNSFAAHNLPDLVLVELRARNVPLSYANAFMSPVYPTQGQSLMEASMRALDRYLGQMDAMYELAGERRHAATGEFAVSGSQRSTSLAELVAQVRERLT